MLRKLLIGVLILGSFFIWSGCGGNHDAPEGSIITINPGETTITDAGLVTETDTEYFQIVVTNQSGVPLNNVRIWVSYPWAVPSPAGAVQLYDGEDPKDSPMKVETDDNGAFSLRIDYLRGGGVEYFGNIEVTSGSVFGSATFTVSTGSEEEG